MSEEKIIAAEDILSTGSELNREYPFLTFITAVDYIAENYLQLVYHIQSIENKKSLILKVKLPRKNPEIFSVAALWPAAEWHEREVFDLFGVNFVHNPDLRRILLPDDWIGHPLLKDYVDAKMIKRPESV